MTDLFQSKSTLARLLAQENINVEHRKVHTAMFDLKSRTLVLPMLKDMDGDLYDGLTGHEVGHALYTPEEGWHTAIKQDRSLKGYLNIIEDARIERKMKERFPGLRRSFNLAYKHLHELDFFGLRGLDVNRLMLIDRINIFYKIGSFVRVGFTPAELTYIDRISAAQTWEDVEVIARELHAKAKEDKKNNPEPQTDTHESDEGEDESDAEYGESDESDDSDESEEWDDLSDMSYEDDSEDKNDSEESEDSDGSDESESTDEQSTDCDDGDSGASKDDKSDEDESDDGDGEDEENKNTGRGGSSNGDGSDENDEKGADGDKSREGGNQSEPDPDVSSHTDKAFRDNEKLLIDTSTGNTYVVNVPQFNKNYLVSHQKVHASISAHIQGLTLNNVWIDHKPMIKTFTVDNVQDFIKRSTPVVNYMVKEFEMRKNATQLARAKQHKSGKINPKRLSRYTMENDIFQRISSIPQGKNHGLVMVIDLSGSMTDILKNAFEQAMMLTMFCRKVNIPFDVYGFCDDTGSSNLLDSKRTPYYTRNNNDLAGWDKDFTMKQYLSSTMTSSQYRKAFANMMYIGSVYGAYRTGNYRNLSEAIPQSERLGGTPLDEAIIASIDLVGEFKVRNRLDIVNCVFLTDGCGGVSNVVYNNKGGKYDYENQTWMYPERDTIYLQHKGTKHRVRYQSMLKNDCSGDQFISSRALIEIAKRVTGAKYTGYLVSSRRDITRFVYPYEYSYVNHNTEKVQRKSLNSQLVDDGFVSSHKFGFDEYFFVPNDNLKIDEHGIEVESEASKSKIAKAFMKSLDKRGLQRMFLNKFVQTLAA